MKQISCAISKRSIFSMRKTGLSAISSRHCVNLQRPGVKVVSCANRRNRKFLPHGPFWLAVLD